MLKQQCRSDWVLHWPEPKFLSLSFGPGANTGATWGHGPRHPPYPSHRQSHQFVILVQHVKNDRNAI